jgi:hypothetical protein
MPVFTTDKKNYLIRESKSWASTVIFTLIVYGSFKLFLSMRQDTVIIGLVSVFLLKLIDTLTQYHVNVIQIDKEKGKMNLRLNSLLTGYDYKTYKLQEVASELTETKSWLNFNQTVLRLRIYLPGKKVLQITNRYGFTDDTLKLIDDTLKI